MGKYSSTNSKTTTSSCKALEESLISCFSDVFISFGGLLMQISGDVKNLKNLEVDVVFTC